jgi:hypothetical protein
MKAVYTSYDGEKTPKDIPDSWREVLTDRPLAFAVIGEFCPEPNDNLLIDFVRVKREGTIEEFVLTVEFGNDRLVDTITLTWTETP